MPKGNARPGSQDRTGDREKQNRQAVSLAVGVEHGATPGLA